MLDATTRMANDNEGPVWVSTKFRRNLQEFAVGLLVASIWLGFFFGLFRLLGWTN